jgi:hypothetical protein
MVRAKVILNLLQRPAQSILQAFDVGTGERALSAALPCFVGQF